jgi:transcriptional regulator with XRE-family HTH domain
MSDLQDFIERQLAEDGEFRKYWERSEPLYGVIKDVLRRRIDLGLSQADLADRMGKKQPSVARFEAGNAENPTLAFLQALADALDMQLSVHLVPKEEPNANKARLVAEEQATYNAS